MPTGSEPSWYFTPSTGMRSPKSVLKQSTPMSMSASSLLANHALAAGLVKSTIAMPGCQRSVCQTLPSVFLMK
ncbi:MAG: hypothetical protein BWX86_02566 [Verrucomicrobia bacterium ADurb.Bin122]|nr:MAG: hypothetical protein BWX86_02566 [Verrucomicrobia bacterium ADurb.Bin122]